MMRRLFRFGLLAAAVAGFGLVGGSALQGSGHARADGAQHETMTTQTVVFNDCNGDVIEATITIDAVMTPSGNVNLTVHGTGVSQDGTPYVLNATEHAKADQNGNFTVHAQEVLVSKGSDPNEILTITIDQNGFNVSTKCVG